MVVLEIYGPSDSLSLTHTHSNTELPSRSTSHLVVGTDGEKVVRDYVFACSTVGRKNQTNNTPKTCVGQGGVVRCGCDLAKQRHGTRSFSILRDLCIAHHYNPLSDKRTKTVIHDKTISHRQENTENHTDNKRERYTDGQTL